MYEKPLKFRWGDFPTGGWVSVILRNPSSAKSQYMRFPDYWGKFICFDGAFTHLPDRPMRLLLPEAVLANALQCLPRQQLTESAGKDVKIELRKLPRGRMEIRRWEAF